MAEKDILEYLYGDQAYDWKTGTIDPEDEDLTIFDYTKEARKGLEKFKPGEVLGELKDITKKVSDYDIGDLNYWTYRAPSSEENADKAAQIYKEKLVKKLENQGYIGDEYDRYDRGPWGSEEAKKSGMATEQATSLAKAIANRGKKKETPYDGPLGKMGEYFSKNADARDKLFSMIGSMGRELVKPIQPGQEAAGALIPTLARGMEAGGKRYAAEKLAETELLLKRSEATQKANPLQYFTSKMKELRYEAVNAGIDPDTADGARWMGQQLAQIGINEGAALLSKSIKDAQDSLMSITDPEKKKEQQKLIDQLNGQLMALVTQGLDGGASGSYIPYSPQ